MSADQGEVLWIMCSRAALYGIVVTVGMCLVIAAADRWWNK